VVARDDGLASDCTCHGGLVPPRGWALPSSVAFSVVRLLPAASVVCGGCSCVVRDLGEAPWQSCSTVFLAELLHLTTVWCTSI
jgi:hypothetical protein